MRRKCLLSVAMLSVLLATSACTAGTSAQVSSPQPAGNAGGAFTEPGDGGSFSAGTGSGKRSEIGISQWNAAEAAKTAAATKTAAASTGATPPAVPAKSAAAGKGKSAAHDDREDAKAGAAQSAAAKAATAAAKAAAADKESKIAAAKAAAKKAAKAAAAKKVEVPVPVKTPPVDAPGLKHVMPVPVTPKVTPAPAESASPEPSNVDPASRFHLPDALSYFTGGDSSGDSYHRGDHSGREGHKSHREDSSLSVDTWIGGQDSYGDGTND
jgi:hypothetical protein